MSRATARPAAPIPASDKPARACSPLELLLPHGTSRRSALIGTSCPTALHPGSCGHPDASLDLVVLAPTAIECRSPGWLAAAATAAAGRLDADGLVYALVPAPWRRQTIQLLRRQGLQPEDALLHVPDWSTTSYLVPIQRGALHYASTRLIATSRWRRLLSRLARSTPGALALLPQLLPAVAVVARRPGSAASFAWLDQLAPPAHQRPPVVMSTSWRGPGGAVVLHRLGGPRGTVDVVGKLLPTASNHHDLIREAGALAGLGSLARRIGTAVPQALGLEPVGSRLLLLQSAMEGEPVSLLLARAPGRLYEVLERLSAWLADWSRATATMTTLDAGMLQRVLLEPAAELAPLLEHGDAYTLWLRARCRSALGLRLPLVAVHNDLTMRNLLLDERGRLSVVDWECASAQGLPLGDFYYAVVDAVAATDGYRSRVAAARACFTPGGAYTGLLGRLQAQLVQALALQPLVVELALHACWLSHACREQRQALPGADRPFLELVAWLAAQCRECLQ